MANISYIRTERLQALLAEVDPEGKLLIRVLTSNELGLGSEPLTPSWILKLSEEIIHPYQASENIDPAVTAGSINQITTDHKERQTGDYSFRISGEIFQCTSLKNLLIESLKKIELSKPGTLDKLSAIKPRSKRIVARNPSDLFERVDLSNKFSEQIMPDWWVGTNNSAQETNSWLRRACELGGLAWGKDFSINL